MNKTGASMPELRKRLNAVYGTYPNGGWTSFVLGDA
jgi:hypothetical protein